MAVLYTCDGCNGVSDKDKLVSRGISELVYCPICLPIIDQFLEERDKLHDNVQKMWADGIKKLQDDCHSKLIEAVPDEV